MPDESENKSYEQRNQDEANDAKNKLGPEDKGLKWERGCTDILCCLIFIVFTVAILGVSFYALGSGDPSRIMTPFDSDGNACGQPDQCSMDHYAWPQGTPCPKADKTDGDEKYSEFKLPANYTAPITKIGRKKAGETVRIPEARDFTDYPYKYFTLTSAIKGGGFFTAVCVKECPASDIKGKEEQGACVKMVEDEDTKGLKAVPGVKGKDYEVISKKENVEQCQNACWMDLNCNAYEFTKDKKCNHWIDPKGDAGIRKQVDPPKGDGSVDSKCVIKDTSSELTKVEYLPNQDESGIPALKGALFSPFSTTTVQNTYCLPKKEYGIQLVNDMISELDGSTGFTKYLVEIAECKNILIGMSFATVVISLFYIWLLKCITKPLLYTSMFLILILFILSGAWCWMKKDDFDQEKEKNNYQLTFGAAIAMWSIAALYLCFICCCWSNIALGASIMEAASAFVTSTIRVILLPLIAFAACVPYIAYWVISAVYLYSVGQPYFEDGSFFAEIRWSDQTRQLWWFFLFGLIWSIAMIICLQQFMIAATVCQWYFSGQGRSEVADSAGHGVSLFTSFKWGIWYHCGSIAFGSFIIAVITFIRIVFEYLVYQFEKMNPSDNVFYRCAKCYVRYVLWCLDKYIKFITKNAFIQIALRSISFCPAAWGSFYLVMRNAGRFSATSMVGWIMMFLGKGTIMGASCYLTFLLVQGQTDPEIKQPFIPAIIILMVAYLVGSMFLSIFSFAATAILHCFILDEDTGGASALTPPALVPFLEKYDKSFDKQKYTKDDSKPVTGTGKEGSQANDMN